MSTAAQKKGAAPPRTSPSKIRRLKYNSHSDKPPCHCEQCELATRLADQRRRELDAIFRQLDAIDDVVAREVTHG